MLVSEVITLANWIEEELSTPSIAQMYTKLSNKLQNNMNGQSQPFEIERSELNKAVLGINLNILSDAQIEILKKIGVYGSIGKAGLHTLNDVFVQNALDLATTMAKVDELRVAVDKANQWAVIAKQALTEHFEDEVLEQKTSGEVVIRVRFTEEAGIYNVVDFKKWAVIWHDILRGFALAKDGKPEDFKFIGGTTGSFITLFASDPINVAAVVIAIERGLAFANAAIDFKLKLRELKSSPFSSKKGISALEESMKVAKSEAPDKLVTEILGEAKEDKKDGEKRTALKKAIEKMLDFLEKGGEVDFVVPDNEEFESSEEDFEETIDHLDSIRSRVQKIRETERTTLLLESKNQEDSD